ncbi:MAG: GAF domain-containing protein [Clostridia bacterium]|nr:GAF domain-containing protein [Clostridia bacterium]
MNYDSILKTIEEQKKSEDLSAKLFRYTGLIQAIEFFSQKLNFEQIIDAAFDFVNELLTLDKSAIFVLQGSNYVLKKSKGYDCGNIHIKNNEGFNEIAVFHGTLIHDQEKLSKFFPKEVLDEYAVTTVIPLIIENNLYGFVFISHKAAGDLNGDDYIISEALMKLFNNALENYKRYEELQKANRELDEKIFNLFAINHSSKALLSELNLDILYNLSVDVFSELTQSSVTGFVLYDEKSENYRVKACKDIYNNDDKRQIALNINKLAIPDMNKVIIDTANPSDERYFNSIFAEGLQTISPLKPSYIVLLLKNGKILGFVTLGQTVTGYAYKRSIFELIESLASSTYIAVSNAQLFKQVNEQKKIIQGKLEKLTQLNNLMKNINSSANMDTLLEITLKTLEVSFDVDKALIALYDKEKQVFNISHKLNVDTRKREIKTNANWNKVVEGEIVFEAREEGVSNYIGKGLLEDLGHVPGVVIAPIHIDRVETEILGVIIIFKYRKLLISDEENLLTIETIANHISPVLSNLFVIEEQKRFSLPNYIELFKRDLKEAINEAKECAIPLEVVQVTDCRDFIFKNSHIIDKLRNNFERVYPFSYNNIFIISNDKKKDISKRIKKAAGIDEVKVRELVLGKDFDTFQEFFNLF